MKCGCKIITGLITLKPRKVVPDKIVYCPKHAAVDEMVGIIDGMFNIKNLWMPFDDPPPEHVGEYEALWSAHSQMKALLDEIGENK